MIVLDMILTLAVALLPFVSLPAPARTGITSHPYAAEMILRGQQRQAARERAMREFDVFYANVDPVKVAARIEFDRIAQSY